MHLGENHVRRMRTRGNPLWLHDEREGYRSLCSSGIKIAYSEGEAGSQVFYARTCSVPWCGAC